MAQEFRSAVRVLECRGHFLVAEGKHDEAVRTGLQLLRLADDFTRNPTLLAYLVANVGRNAAIVTVNLPLQTGPVTKEARHALDAELAVQERMEGFAWALKSDRSYVLESFTDQVPARNFWLISRGVWNMQESACLELFPTLIALADHSRSYRAAEQTIEGKHSVMAALLFPGLKGAYVFVAQTRAGIRCLRVLNALQSHVPVGSKEVPKLTELGLPADTITDPFTGDPLHVKRTPQGWLVYSVGPNLKDDGGKLDDNSDVGVGPPPAANSK
jgi:hypothetical protein